MINWGGMAALVILFVEAYSHCKAVQLCSWFGSWWFLLCVQTEDLQKALDELDDVQSKVEACREKLIKESRERNRLHGLCQVLSPLISKFLLQCQLHRHFFIYMILLSWWFLFYCHNKFCYLCGYHCHHGIVIFIITITFIILLFLLLTSSPYFPPPHD